MYNHSTLTGTPVKDAKNPFHNPSVFHHRLISNGAQFAIHDKGERNFNKMQAHGNPKVSQKDKNTVSKKQGSFFRIKTPGLLILGGLIVIIVYSNTR